MARTFITGFSTGDVALDGLGTLPAQASYETTIVRTGPRSLKYVAASGVSSSVGTSGTSTRIRFYIRVTVRPSTTARVIYGTTGASSTNLRLNPSGTIAHYVGSTLTGTSTTALTDTSRWYMIEAYGTSGTSVVVLRIDGVDEITGSPTTSTFTHFIGASDTVADTYTAYFADLATDNAAFPGEGKVVQLYPISDNARAAKWTGGAGGTTNLWDAVNNTPPAGLASASATNTSQIEHAGSGAGNEDYDANMTTYANAGIGASDTITAIQTQFCHGEDIATGSKTLTWGVKSNPAGSFETNIIAGGDIGAVGTYPTNWQVLQGTIINNPSVTIASSPVMTARRPLTESRVASVCFMGMRVEYLAATFIATPPHVISQVINRASLY